MVERVARGRHGGIHIGIIGFGHARHHVFGIGRNQLDQAPAVCGYPCAADIQVFGVGDRNAGRQQGHGAGILVSRVPTGSAGGCQKGTRPDRQNVFLMAIDHSRGRPGEPAMAPAPAPVRSNFDV